MRMCVLSCSKNPSLGSTAAGVPVPSPVQCAPAFLLIPQHLCTPSEAGETFPAWHHANSPIKVVFGRLREM